MVDLIRRHWAKLDWLQKLIVEGYGIIVVMMIIFTVGIFVGGCRTNMVQWRQASHASALPAAIQSYEVPITDTSAIPELLHLAPGQSAMLLKDVVVVARIPYNGNELYVGEVKLAEGTMLVKPRVE